MAQDIGGFDSGMIWDAQLVELGAVGNSSVSPLDAASGDGVVGGGIFADRKSVV